MAIKPDIRKRTEEREEAFLSPYAVNSCSSRGRIHYEKPCSIRTEFQRDRDRIIHCKAFRRLKHKTQVFIAPTGDHFVTRLTHTLEVTQIARTITRALGLNEDLAEAISLGHDLGHTPFGHMGESTLNQLYHEGFRHNTHSLRVVDRLERGGRGLNLTWEVRDGIINHSKSMEEILGREWGQTGSFEADVVKISDLVAYINHDIDDAIRAGIITIESLPESARQVLGDNHSKRVSSMVTDIIAYSWPVSGETTSTSGSIGMSPSMKGAAEQLREFLFDRVYIVQHNLNEAENARQFIAGLYNYFCKHPEELPDDYQLENGQVERAVVDYIAGMTDQYAAGLYEKIFL